MATVTAATHHGGSGGRAASAALSAASGCTGPEARPSVAPKPDAADPLDGLERAVSIIGSLLRRLGELGDASPFEKTVFHGSKIPPIAIEDYVKRLRKYCHCTDLAFVCALIYLDRVIKTQEALRVNSLSVHRLFLASLRVASKFHDDIFYSNQHFAAAGGIALAEMNDLELEILFALEFDLYVSDSTIDTYRAALGSTKSTETLAGVPIVHSAA